MGDTSLVNLGKFSKPVNTLIEKISDAIGGIFEPWQIRRIARAEAEADEIRTVSQIKTTEMQRRAVIRLITEEGKKQENIESITRKAIEGVKEDARPQDIENDWIANFFDK